MLPIIASMSRRRFTKSFSLHTELKKLTEDKTPNASSCFPNRNVTFPSIAELCPTTSTLNAQLIYASLVTESEFSALHTVSSSYAQCFTRPPAPRCSLSKRCPTAQLQFFLYQFTQVLPSVRSLWTKRAFRTISLNTIFHNAVRIRFSWDQWEEV